MSFLFCDGFAQYAAASDFAKRGWSNTGTVTWQSSGGPFGGAYAQLSPNATMTIPVAGNPVTVFLNCFLRVDQIRSLSSEIVRFHDSAAALQTYLRQFNAGFLDIITSGAAKAQALRQTPVGEWFHLEMKLTVDNAGVGEPRIDGRPLWTGTIDTLGTANVNCGGIQFKAGNTDTLDVANVVIFDNAGGSFDDWQGPIKIETIKPDGDAAVQFTPDSGGTNYTQVDDVNADDDTTFVESSTVNHEDFYTYEALSSGVNSILGVAVGMRAKDTGAGRGMKVSAREGTPTIGRSAEFSLTGGYAFYQHLFETNPDTAAAWTKAEVDGADFGFQIST